MAPLEHFVKAREARLREREAQRQAQPIFTQVVTINYANAARLQPNLEKLLSDRGSLAVDTRTNTIIVNDTQAAISTIADLVATLDRPTPQIMIESRIVETSRNFLRELGVQLAGRAQEKINASFPSAVSIFGAGTGGDAGVPGNFILDLPARVGTGAGGSLGISFTSVGSSFLDVQLSALEASGRGKVISRPRIATLDNTEALIQSGRRIPFETTSANQGTQTQFADASISLRVTPHVDAARLHQHENPGLAQCRRLHQHLARRRTHHHHPRSHHRNAGARRRHRGHRRPLHPRYEREPGRRAILLENPRRRRSLPQNPKPGYHRRTAVLHHPAHHPRTATKPGNVVVMTHFAASGPAYVFPIEFP